MNYKMPELIIKLKFIEILDRYICTGDTGICQVLAYKETLTKTIIETYLSLNVNIYISVFDIKSPSV